MPASLRRNYSQIASRLGSSGLREERMRRLVDVLWDSLNDSGVSWAGFYIDHPGAPDHQRLVLGPCRDKPACSPIGLHGVCGQALLSRTTRIIRDVRELGSSYIACDPRDQSEIVIPLIDERGRCWGVLDLDSHEIGAFDESDDRGLREVLRAAGFAAGAAQVNKSTSEQVNKFRRCGV